jgi:hypothetical protein
VVDEKPIWQRIETDTDKSFAAFCVYRDLGADRSLEKAFRQYSGDEKAKLPGYFGRWSAENSWAERAAAYDDYLLDEHRREREARQKVVETNAWSDYNAIRQGITKSVDLFSKTGWQPDINAMRDLLRLMKEADDLARRSVGLPDRINESKTEVTGKDGGAIEVAFPKFVRAVPPNDSSSD